MLHKNPTVMIAFGPVPSRRLGQSLGINHIPPKNCTYNCVYCQVGPTPEESIQRHKFYAPETVVQDVERKVEEVRSAGGRIDYLTFVPDGEPALDLHLGELITQLRHLSIPIAVISNASLIWRHDVRKELLLADLVSLKIDSVADEVWQKINRPQPSLFLDSILEGALKFAREYHGHLITETMLVKGVNDHPHHLRDTAEYLHKLNPETAYICVPTRPPSESWAQPPGEQALAEAYYLFSEQVKKAELLIGFPEEEFLGTGDILQSILDTTSVHPMRESEVLALLARNGLEARKLDELVAEEKLVRVSHAGQVFYVRKLPLKVFQEG
jgi:wyosine [tRNA(Phe)-imidazoG37] synthetase (radical SAM superfamily)